MEWPETDAGGAVLEEEEALSDFSDPPSPVQPLQPREKQSEEGEDESEEEYETDEFEDELNDQEEHMVTEDESLETSSNSEAQDVLHGLAYHHSEQPSEDIVWGSDYREQFANTEYDISYAHLSVTSNNTQFSY